MIFINLPTAILYISLMLMNLRPRSLFPLHFLRTRLCTHMPAPPKSRESLHVRSRRRHCTPTATSRAKLRIASGLGVASTRGRRWTASQGVCTRRRTARAVCTLSSAWGVCVDSRNLGLQLLFAVFVVAPFWAKGADGDATTVLALSALLGFMRQMLTPPQSLHLFPARFCWQLEVPPVLTVTSLSVMLADGGAPAVLVLAPHSGLRADHDVGAPALLASLSNGCPLKSHQLLYVCVNEIGFDCSLWGTALGMTSSKRTDFPSTPQAASECRICGRAEYLASTCLCV